jgi:hypothetical protein
MFANPSLEGFGVVTGTSDFERLQFSLRDIDANGIPCPVFPGPEKLNAENIAVNRHLLCLTFTLAGSV